MYDLEKLICYAQDVMDNEKEYHLGLVNPPSAARACDIEYKFYWKGELSARSYESWNGLHVMCGVLGVDEEKVISIAKSIRRWETHGGKYDRIFSWEGRTLRKIERFLCSAPAMDIYATTGRPIK